MRQLFYGGLAGATLGALYFGAIVAAILLAILFAITSLMDRTIPLTVIKSLPIVGVLFAFIVVSGISQFILKAGDKTEAEQGDASDS